MQNKVLFGARLLSLWAKTSESGQGTRFHPLLWHLLDVAAVAERLLDEDRFLRRFASERGVDRAALSRFLLLLIALHDIGKCAFSMALA